MIVKSNETLIENYMSEVDSINTRFNNQIKLTDDIKKDLQLEVNKHTKTKKVLLVSAITNIALIILILL